MMALPVVTQITDAATLPFDVLVARLPARRIAIQIRDKDLPLDERRALASRVLEAAKNHLVLLNASTPEEWNLVTELGLAGAHLPSPAAARIAEARNAIGNDRLLTVACHTLVEVTAAAMKGADAALLSPIFVEQQDVSKKGTALGTQAIQSARLFLSGLSHRCRVVALGGITSSERAQACLAAGAHGIAGIRADLSALLPA